MRFPNSLMLSSAALLLATGFSLPGFLNAADEPAKKPAAAGKTADAKAAEKGADAQGEAKVKDAAGDKDVLKQWADLQARYKKIIDTVTSMQQEIENAKPDAKKELTDKLVKLVPGFQKDMQAIQPKLIELAPKVLEKDPANVEAAELVVQLDFMKNKYAEIIAITDPLIAKGKATPPLVTLGGIAHFAIHDFAKAQKMLQEAEKADNQLFPRLGAPFLAYCADYIDLWKKEQAIRAAEAKADDLPRVSFKTSKGEIVLELFENEAPNTVANFINLVEAKKYDGIVFHRVIPNFMAQGGDPNTLDEDPNNDGQGGPGYTIACECYADNARKHFQGSLSMAHAGKDTGGSQFFLTHLPTAHLNANADEQRGHTVFGRIIKGLNVAAALQIGDKIETASVIRKRKHDYVPKKTADAAAPEKSGRIKVNKSRSKESTPKSEDK